MDTHQHYELFHSQHGHVNDRHDHPLFQQEERRPGCLVEPGEFSRQHLHDACWELIHSNPHSCLASDDPLVQALAVLHEKVGVARLRSMRGEDLHPLVRTLLELRLDAEHALKRAVA